MRVIGIVIGIIGLILVIGAISVYLRRRHHRHSVQPSGPPGAGVLHEDLAVAVTSTRSAMTERQTNPFVATKAIYELTRSGLYFIDTQQVRKHRQEQDVESTEPHAEPARASMDVPELVELVYQRLQLDRPRYVADEVGLPAYELPVSQ
jgi:hypothetical protein